MKFGYSSILAAIFFMVMIVESPAQEETQVSKCIMQVNVSPANRQIVCKAKFENISDTSFILNNDMEIHWISVDGKPVSYIKRPTDLVENAVEISIPVPAVQTINFVYTGKILTESYSPVISAVNMVRPKLIELALYTAWYPRPKESSFAFELEADVPADFVTITNGFLVEQKTANDRSKTTWQSDGPVSDIVLLAAPDLNKSTSKEKNLTIEIYYDKVAKDYIEKIQSQLGDAVKELENLFGPARSNKLVRVVYSPRQGWGYVRKPLIIVSEGQATDWRWQKFGPERDFRYLTHEIAHYWWALADVNTPDDWINEGLAEYSAFVVSEAIIGLDFTSQLLKEYRQRAAKSKTETAIAETPGSSPDREVNRYDKPVLLFIAARQRFGKEETHQFLKTFYRRYAGSRNVTTALFLQHVRSELGTEAESFFEQALYNPQWKGSAN